MGDALSFTGLEGLVRAGGLHVVRILAAIAVLPFFGPAPAKLQKIGLACVLGGAVVAARGLDHLQDPGDEPVRLVLLTIKEILFGLVIGWLAGLVFESVRIAGALLATEMGLNMANQVDPVTRSSQPLLSHLFEAIALVLFFTGGGAGSVIRALVASFEGVPVGSFSPSTELAGTMLSFTGDMMLSSLRFAGPVFVLLVIVTMVVGLLSKVAPALNVLEASYPIRILGALLLLAIFLPSMMHAFDGAVSFMSQGLEGIAKGGL